jgi:hypothetical protein
LQATANINTIALQLPLCRENEGLGPIIVKATEQSMMMEEEDQMMARQVEPARRRRLLTRGNTTTAFAADKR